MTASKRALSALLGLEYSSDKQCLQTIAYGDGDADDFTHLIEHEHILKTLNDWRNDCEQCTIDETAVL